MSETPIDKPVKGKPPVDRNGNPVCGKPGRSGAPRENRNALRHGLRAGALPADCKYIEVRLNGFRRQQEDSAMAVRGEVTLQDAANIQTCLRWERHAYLAQRWLNKQYDELKPTDRLSFSREVARASAERDKSLKMLGLDKEAIQDNSIESLYTIPVDDDGGDT